MRPLLRRCSLVLCALLLLLGSCSEPTRPVEAPLPHPAPHGIALSASHGGLDLEPLARFHQKPAITIAWAKKWIGPEGGRLDFHGFAVEVPPGAVDRLTQFSIRLPVDPRGSERVVAEFGPHGSTFAHPVAIELPYAGTTLFGTPSPTVVWGDPQGGVWVDIGAQPTADGLRLRALTTHFSIYGTTQAYGGTLTASGG